MCYLVYILRTSKNSLYTGITKNIEKRLSEHKNSKRGAKYMSQFASFDLVYTEEAENRSAALKREAAIKKLSKVEKERLVSEFGNGV